MRFTYDNNYFDALYQGIPMDGYTAMVERMLSGIDVRLNTDYLQDREYWDSLARRVIFTGPIDVFYGCSLGALEYRTLKFETETLAQPNFQGNAVINFTDRETPWTRIIEHKWFSFGLNREGRELPHTVITREYSRTWHPGDEPFYPVNDEKNSALYLRYRQMAERETKVRFGGRLGAYRYDDMDTVIASALSAFRQDFGNEAVLSQ